MASLVQQLIEAGLDKNVSVSDLLRRALVVARRLKSEAFEAWITQELEGYQEVKGLPVYRIVQGEIKVLNPYHGWIPIMFKDEETAKKMSTQRIVSKVAELEDLVRSAKGNSGAVLTSTLPPAIANRLTEKHGLPVAAHVTPTSMEGIVDAVRTAVLKWALKLEEQGITGEGSSFTDKERTAAAQLPHSINYYIQNVSGSQLQVGTTQSALIAIKDSDLKNVLAFVNDLESKMNQLQLTKESNEELRAEIATVKAQVASPQPKGKIINESLSSLRRILEGATGSLAATLVRAMAGLPL